MTTPADLRPLERALDAARAPVTFFFRDDDGGWADLRLRALLDVHEEYGMPVDLALIPDALSPWLIRHLERRASRNGLLGLHQHGRAHVNHETTGRKCEFGESRVAGNLWRYALRSAQIIFRCYRDYHPLRFFGGIALGLCVPALLLGAFLLLHYLETGALTPHKWAGFGAAALLVLALLVLQMGVVGDMLARHRVYLEEVLFRLRNRPGP